MYISKKENLSDFMGIFFPHLRMCLDNLTLVTQITGNHERSIESFFVAVFFKNFILEEFYIYRKVAELELRVTLYPSPSFP